MADLVIALLSFVIAIWVIVVIIRGTFRAFSRNFFLALILFLILTPFFFVWAFIEGIPG